MNDSAAASPDLPNNSPTAQDHRHFIGGAWLTGLGTLFSRILGLLRDIATAALLVASKIEPEIMNYCVFAHCSDEVGHKLLLQQLEAEPLLDIGLRLGEGTGPG